MNIEISTECDEWLKYNVNDITFNVSDVVFSKMHVKHDNLEVCFLFTDNNEMRILNKTYRGIDKPTNILSFPVNIDADYDDAAVRILGSIAIAFETVLMEATNQKKTFEDHLMHLIVHGLLHLLGYGHASSDEADKMEQLEINILEKLNVADPYKERDYL